MSRTRPRPMDGKKNPLVGLSEMWHIRKNWHVKNCLRYRLENPGTVIYISSVDPEHHSRSGLRLVFSWPLIISFNTRIPSAFFSLTGNWMHVDGFSWAPTSWGLWVPRIRYGRSLLPKTGCPAYFLMYIRHIKLGNECICYERVRFLFVSEGLFYELGARLC